MHLAVYFNNLLEKSALSTYLYLPVFLTNNIISRGQFLSKKNGAMNKSTCDKTNNLITVELPFSL